MKIYLLALFPILLLSGCGSTSHERSIQDHPYDPANSARIRLYGNNGLLAEINPGQACDSSKEPLGAYGQSFADKINSTLGQHTKRSVGMPISWKSAHLSYGESYSEFVIPAGKPSVVRTRLLTAEVRCAPDARVFVPEAGKDYEAYLYRHDGMCVGMIRLLSDLEKPGPIADVSSTSCSK